MLATGRSMVLYTERPGSWHMGDAVECLFGRCDGVGDYLGYNLQARVRACMRACVLCVVCVCVCADLRSGCWFVLSEKWVCSRRL